MNLNSIFKRFFDAGQEKGATHLVFLSEDESSNFFPPVFIMPHDSLSDVLSKNKTKNIIAVYNIHSMNWDDQKSLPRALNTGYMSQLLLWNRLKTTTRT